MWPAMLMYINHTFRNAFQTIHVKSEGLNLVKDLISKKQKVIMIPVYKSFLDLSVLLYSFVVNGMDFPFSLGNADDIPTAALMDKVLANSGYVPTRRSR